jgi:hypothetical protein
MPSTVTDRLAGASASVAVKAPCRVATTANITLSGLQTIDGISVVAEDRVLVKDQSTASENGIYICQSTAWERAPDFDGARDVVTGTLVPVNLGTANAGFIFKVTTTGTITIGTTSITFAASTFTDLAVSVWWQSVLAENSTAATLSALGFSAYIQTFLDDSSAINARQTLGFPGGSTYAGGVATVSTLGTYRGSSLVNLSTAAILKGHGSQPNRSTSTAVTLASSDAGTVLIIAASATAVVTAPSSTSTLLPEGFQVAITQNSTASVRVAVQAGDSPLRSKFSRDYLSGQYAMATLYHQSATAGAWQLAGDIST